MTLRARLVWMGAVLPALALLVVVAGAGVVFRLSLLSRVDAALLAQAAAESVSLFDGGRNAHLHVDRSPVEAARRAAARSALYGPDGGRLHVAGEAADFPTRWADAPPAQPKFTTQPAGAWRELRIGLPGADGTYLLVMRASLASVRATMTAYWLITGLAAGLVLLLLGALQAVHAWRLEARVRRIAEHVHAVREGDLAARPAPDRGQDIIARLRDDVAETTARLQAARVARERLVADAAHELKTPLAAMRAQIDTTVRRQRTADELVESLSAVGLEVDRLAGLATRLLSLARLSQGTDALAETDLRAVVDAAVGAARPVAEAREQSMLVRGPEIAPLTGDPAALRQAVDNLLANALRHGPVHSVIELSLAPREAGWRLVVADEGPGVAASVKAHLFEPFARADRTHGGAGLGLAIARTVARRHHGDLVLLPGPGARFALELGTQA